MNELYKRFESIANASPNSGAISHAGTRIDYGDLQRLVSRIASALAANGARPEEPIGICFEPGIDMVAAVLAAARVGAPYVPIDTRYPDERVATIVDGTRMRLLLRNSATPDSAALSGLTSIYVDQCDAPTEPSRDHSPPVHPEQALYVLFTSGSTGVPKGVVVTHHNVTQLLDAALPRISAVPDDVWTLFHSLSFDFSAWELWAALTTGARLVIVPTHIRRSTVEFYELLVRERVTVLNQTPSAFYGLMAVDEREHGPLAVDRVVFGGERLNMDLVRSWRTRTGRAKVRLINMYGITETTVHSTAYELSDNDPTGASVIGAALPHLSAVVMGPDLRPLEVGRSGELFIGGHGLARGYLNRPDQTAERYLPDPSGTGGRVYRTGDLVVQTSNGNLEYCGRVDHQIKIRGHRIEPEEIERALAQHPAVEQAIVGLVGDHVDGVLRAYIVAAVGARSDCGDVRAFLRDRLPEYLVPGSFVLCPALPLTDSGKIARARVHEISGVELLLERPHVEPSNDRERAVCNLVSRRLGVDAVGMDDNFFELGGHSLMLVEVVMDVKSTFGIDVDLQRFFSEPTPRVLVEAIADGQPNAAVAPSLANPLADDEAFRSFLRTVGDPESLK